MQIRNDLQQMVWEEMGHLASSGLGYRDESKKSRDNFILRGDLVGKLAERPLKEGFLRSDKSHGLLIRAANRKLIESLPPEFMARAKEHKNGGPEFRWSDLTAMDIKRIMAAVIKCASE